MIRNGSDIRQDDPDGYPMSVPLLKQKLRNASIGRVTNGVEIGMEPVQSGVFVGTNVQENLMEEEHQETAQMNQQRNNTFMMRNVKVREWTGVNRENVNGEDGIRTDVVAQKEEKKRAEPNTNIMAKEAEAVDTLRRKLEMKKLESKQETFGSNKGLVLRKNERSVFQHGFDEYEETTNIFKNESDSRDRSHSTASSSLTMVNVSPNSNPKAKISFSSFDKSKEDYVSQFSEKPKPISEASPIKAQLESIISGKIQENAGVQEKDIVFTTQSKEDEENAKQAAVKAMELAFMRKKKQKEEEERKKEEAQKAEESDEESMDRNMDGGIPVPAKRQSLKKTDETRTKTVYKEMNSKSELNSSIRIVEFSNSGTDYNNITKANQSN